MAFQKITHGFVIQNFDDNGRCTDQEFICGDYTEYEIDGEPMEDTPEYTYQPYFMVQPKPY